ncbi:hypothetical protein [Ruegeria arenilitoris]|uniref:hypothetical protein n=1 Tax=Ruegeria arenilitoris TaxID=1173585 RepID=UPI001481C86A|nr:hypothetical protein [Ruegeria arenilitoris]
MTDHADNPDDWMANYTQRSTPDPLVESDDVETGWALLKDALYEEAPAGQEIERKLKRLREERDDRQLKRMVEMDVVRLSAASAEQKEQRIREIRRDAAEDKDLFLELREPLEREKERLYASLKANYFNSRSESSGNGPD